MGYVPFTAVFFVAALWGLRRFSAVIDSLAERPTEEEVEVKKPALKKWAMITGVFAIACLLCAGAAIAKLIG